MSSDMGQHDSAAAEDSQQTPASKRSSIDTTASLNSRYHSSKGLQHASKKSNDGPDSNSVPKPEDLVSQQAVYDGLPGSFKSEPQTFVKEPKPRSLTALMKKLQDKAKASAKVEPDPVIGQISPEMARKFDSTDQSRLLRLLRSNTPRTRNERDEAVICTLEMRTKPTVVFSCRTDVREQQIRKALTGSLFKHCLGQCGYEAVTKVDVSVGYRGAYAGPDEKNTLDPNWAPDKQYVDVLLSSGAETLRGSLIMVSVSTYSGTDRKTKSVYSTFGGLLSVDGNSYGLTTAHAVWAETPDNPPTADELPEWVQLAGTDLLPASGQVKGSNQNSYAVSPEHVDWLLFAVKPELMLPNLATESWSQKELQSRTEDISCSIHSPKGAISGSLRLATSLVCLQRMDFQGYCIDLHQKLEHGESGSWVIANGKLLGIVVAASDDPPRAYAQAAFDVFGDISERYSSRVALPSRVETDLMNLKRIGWQQDSFLVHDIPIDHLFKAIPLLILSKTTSIDVDSRKHWLLLDRPIEDTSIPLLPAPKSWSPSSLSLTTNTTSYSGLLWLGGLCPVADAVFASCELILADRADLPDEILQSQAGDNLTFLLHAFRALVNIHRLPSFLSALLKEFGVPSEIIPSARMIAEVAIDMDDILLESGWEDSKEQLECTKHELNTREEISGFACLLADLADAVEFDPQKDNLILCFGPFGDWISLYCSEYLRLPYWRWSDESSLQELINEWLLKDVVHPWPRVWIVDTPGRLYSCPAQNADLSKTYKSLMSQLDGETETTLKPQIRSELSAKAAESFEKTLRDRISDADYDAQIRENEKSHGRRRRARRAARVKKNEESDAFRTPHTTALQAAAAYGHRDVVKILLADGADVNAPGRTWGTALQAAARQGNEEVVSMLLTNGANVKARGSSNDSALQTAARSGHKEVVRMLLKYGADPSDIGDGYETPLRSASRSGYTEIVEMLLESGADPNQRGTSYDTALEAAASHGYTIIVDMLLKHGADPNA